MADVTGEPGLEHDSVTNSEVGDILSAFYHDTGRFVAEDNWFFDDVLADSAMLPVMDLEGVALARSKMTRISA